jgi:hypothetical protein
MEEGTSDVDVDQVSSKICINEQSRLKEEEG